METETVLDMVARDWGKNGVGPLARVMGHAVRWRNGSGSCDRMWRLPLAGMPDRMGGNTTFGGAAVSGLWTRGSKLT